jgi:FlaA1/EpsC-like NDP-sugar epimerase
MKLRNEMIMFKGKSVLIFGGTGTLGRTLLRRLLDHRYPPSKIIVFSRDEAKQHDIRVSYLHAPSATDAAIYENFKRAIEFRIGDVRNPSDVLSALRDADIVINAAALKQVPACEYFPEQAVLTNVMGATSIVNMISNNRLPVETVVGISTDKACRPVNVMGMTKAIQERILINANVLNSHTRFVCVRYGNVLASRGSVIPLFIDQIKSGGPITITDERMTRFFISLDDAVDTVFAAIDTSKPGEIYIPTARGARMVDVARAMIGDRNIETKVIGIRPGEKLDEELISDEEAFMTVQRDNFYAIRPMLPELDQGDDIAYHRPLTSAFCSSNNVMSFQEVEALLDKHNLRSIGNLTAVNSSAIT